MKIYDQHLHSLLSFDSSEKWENYLDLAVSRGVTKFVTTEHLDLQCCLLGEDLIPDFQQQNNLIEKLQSKYPGVKLLKGVEIGYKRRLAYENSRIVESGDFDVVVMSVHDSEVIDVATAGFMVGKTADQGYSEYLRLYKNLVEHSDNFDILGHVDYLLRYIDRIDISKHRGELEDIFKTLIEKKKALELNTRFIYAYNDTSYLEYIFNLYYECGGRMVALGSDGHSADKYMGGFDKAIGLLKNIGFTYLSTYEKRQLYQFLI